MILPGSYANGFAPRDGSPLYPELWKGCVGAWAPGLGPTGLTLRDWSGFGNHGTLTNGPVWSVIAGKYSMSLDGSDDFINVTDRTQLRPSEQVSVAMWVRPGNVVGTKILFDKQSLSPYYGYSFYLLGDKVTADSAYNVNSVSLSSVTSLNATSWQHIGFSHDGSTIRIWINGRLDASTPAAGPLTYSLTQDLTIGRRAPNSTGYYSGGIDDICLFSRAINANEFAYLSRRRGIAYEMAPRRRSSSVVQFNRRRRLLLGAQS